MTIIGGSRPRCFVSGGVTLAALCALTYIPPADADPVFTGVGILEGGVYRVSRAQAVSADGMTVVGASQSGSGYEAFRWTFANGIVGLGDLPGGDFRSEAVDVSADGSVIVGWSESAAGVSQEAFRWEAGAMAGLGDLPGGHFFSEAAAVSYDGDVVVGGSSCELGWEAFRWTTADGLVGLGDFPGGELHSEAKDVSADGSVVVGFGTHGLYSFEAFRWTPSTGMVGLGDLPGGFDSSTAYMVSADGTVVVGNSDSETGMLTFRWTEEEGMIPLGDFSALAMSQDASSIVGRYSYDGVHRAIIWDEATGVRNLHELLEADLGLDLTGWTLREARDVSGDGTVIVGVGTNPYGYEEGWVTVIPEPSTLILVAFAACIIVSRRKIRTGHVP